MEVPLKAASAADPIGAALRPEAGPAHEEAQQRRRIAYQPVLSALRMLVGGLQGAWQWCTNDGARIGCEGVAL